MLDEISSLRLRDLEVFIEVARARSLREAARRLQTTSGQISKSVRNVEKRMGTKLLQRSISGVILTSLGTELLEIAKELLEHGEKIENVLAGRKRTKGPKVLAIASTSFLNVHFTSPIACAVGAEEGTAFRFLDLAPDQLSAVGLRGGFDIAVHFGAIPWPTTWLSESVGRSRWILCARADHPLPRKTTKEKALDYPFVTPTYWTNEGLVRGNDQFPVSATRRKQGHETATADAAVPILLASDHVAFLPELLVTPFLERKLLKELRCDDLPVVDREVFLSAKTDSVPNAVFHRLVKRMRSSLS